MADKYFRISGTQTLLACVLDRILREHLRFVPLKHPGWTCEHGGNYRIPTDGTIYHHERSIYLCGAEVEYRRSGGAKSSVEMRVMAIKNHWIALPNGDEYWTITVWGKTPGTKIGPHVFRYSENDNSLHYSDERAELPPRKIDLWWRETLIADPVPLSDEERAYNA